MAPKQFECDDVFSLSSDDDVDEHHRQHDDDRQSCQQELQQQQQNENENEMNTNTNQVSSSRSSNRPSQVSSSGVPSDDSSYRSHLPSLTEEQNENSFNNENSHSCSTTTTVEAAAAVATSGKPFCDISTLLTKELMELSFNDRNQINEEIHGVYNMAITENPAMLNNSIKELLYEINNINIRDKVAYTIATTTSSNNKTLLFETTTSSSKSTESSTDSTTGSSTSTGTSNSSSSSSYVTSRRFQLRFLRAELFDSKKAAIRLCVYLDLIYKLFGIEVLKRPLRTTDFKGKGDKSILRSGLVQLLPYRDRSGRRVMVILSDIMSHNHIIRVKIFLYLLTVASEDVDTQRNGCLFVMWPGKSTNIRMPLQEERNVCRKSLNASPLRVVGIHFCWPDTPLFNFIRSFFMVIIGSDIRARASFHTGEQQEIQYQLMGYGIPTQVLPTTESGQIKTKNYTQWYKTRVMLEKQAALAASRSSFSGDPSSTSSNRKSDPLVPGACYGAIECPRLNDVLYERTKPCMFHPGNTLFKGLLEERKTDHATLTQTAKRDLTWSIVEEVERRRGRFLKWDQRGFWVPIANRSEIRLKVATSLRDFNKHTRALNKCETISSVSCVAFDNKTQDYKHDIKKRRVMISYDELSISNSNKCGCYNSIRGCSLQRED